MTRQSMLGRRFLGAAPAGGGGPSGGGPSGGGPSGGGPSGAPAGGPSSGAPGTSGVDQGIFNQLPFGLPLVSVCPPGYLAAPSAFVPGYVCVRVPGVVLAGRR